MSRFIQRDCPICGAAPPRSAEMTSRARAESMTYDELVPHWNGFFNERVFFSYARCPSCGLLFAPVFFNEDQLAALYAQMPPNMSLVPGDALQKTQRGYFDFLRSNCDLAGDYIEIGPDVGFFTQNCVRDGKFNTYWLFEPNLDVLPALKTAMAGTTFHVIHDMMGFSEVPAGTTGAVVMVHVLDHLLDPVGALRDLREKLKPKGKLLIVTHDETSMLRRVFGPRWVPFCLQHPQLYSRRSMKVLMQAAGFEDVKVRRTTNYFPIHFLLKHLLWASGVKINATPLFGNRSVGLKLGNMITLASRAVGAEQT